MMYKKKKVSEKYFFTFIFLIIHISANNTLGGLILSMLVSTRYVNMYNVYGVCRVRTRVQGRHMTWLKQCLECN